ncbi:Rpp20 subunit of nuclear RNase MRP and P-domain-containing protein [Podospora fimiseda]|uniref:Rpp20 subunit of nuclear RNase MRP and P-domain-containing protein n=1 Tax=Podospora fimiseda TaxID=252190 RepID=A0AAN6YLM7_9PEZI|nr:Rpp20 subunit of nuclear RNase MRP and P-domain-containing protein [Podospora fimiseda]
MSPTPPTLPNNPSSKLPPLSKSLSNRSGMLAPQSIQNIRAIEPTKSTNPPSLPPPSTRSLNPRPPPPHTTPDKSGYLHPPRLPSTIIIKVSSSASFVSLLKRARKALDKANTAKNKNPRRNTGNGIIEDAQDDVVMIATGKAIEKAVEVGVVLGREGKGDLVVVARTRRLDVVDVVDEVVEDEDREEGEEERRVRGVSCLEVGVRWVR